MTRCRAAPQNCFVLSFGHHHILRSDETVPDAITRLVGAPDNVYTVSTRVPLSTTKLNTNNIRCYISYGSANADAVWPELHNKVAFYQPQPWMGYMLFSVFGNVFYRPDHAVLDCTGVRDLLHTAAISKIVRDEEQHGGPVSVVVTCYGQEASLGQYMQVSHGCFLEYMMERFFPKHTTVIARTEELTNLVFIVVDDVAAFAQRSRELGLLTAEDTRLDNALELTHMHACHANMQFTHIGNVSIRYVWGSTQPVIPRCDAGELQAFKTSLDTVTETLLRVMRQVC